MGYHLEEIFANKLQGNLIKNFSLKNLSWFKVGGKADYFYAPHNEDDLIEFLKYLPQDIPLTILGGGSNILVRDSGIRGVVVKLSAFNHIRLLDPLTLRVGAGVLNSSLALFCMEHNIGGLEFISGVPGSIGGGITMNAGCFGREFKDIVFEVQGINHEGKIKVFSNKECGFSYRNSDFKEHIIFTEVVLKGISKDKDLIKKDMQVIKEQREESQPKKVLTGGSTFANPLNDKNYKAWQLIDMVGLRGFRIGGACFSEKHCNFIINEGSASATEIEDLINEAIIRVKAQFNIELHHEIKILGEK